MCKVKGLVSFPRTQELLPACCHRQTGSLASMTPKPICPRLTTRRESVQMRYPNKYNNTHQKSRLLGYTTTTTTTIENYLILPGYPQLEDSALVSAKQAHPYSALRRITTFTFAAATNSLTAPRDGLFSDSRPRALLCGQPHLFWRRLYSGLGP